MHHAIRTRRLAVILAAIAFTMLLPATVLAVGGTFTDDDTSIFEEDIEWLADSGVTLGCNPPANDKFCPKDTVTREQMSAFMRRFAQFLGAEDGIVSQADSAGNASTADSAGNASTVDGKDASDFQPAVAVYDHSVVVAVNSNTTFELAAAEIETKDLLVCVVGSSPVSTILVRASGYTDALDDGESASLRLEVNGVPDFNTTRRLENTDGAFAMELLYEGSGGTESFAVIANEIGGDVYQVEDAQITVELIQDTTCKGGGGIVFDPALDTTGEVGEE